MEQKKYPVKYASKKGKKNFGQWRSFERYTKVFGEEDNESITNEDVSLDELYDIYIVYEIIRSLTLMVIETVI